MSAYRHAIDRTAQAIERRAGYVRNLIVMIALVSVLSVAWALVTWSPVPLVWIALLVPICGCFFFADHVTLDEWRSRLLESWTNRKLDVTAFREAIRANPALPKETTEGMLMTLPSVQDLVTEQGMSAATRQAVAAATLANYRSRADTVGLKVVASAIVGGTLVSAVTLHRRESLVALLSLVLLPVARSWIRRRRFAESRREVIVCRAQPDFSEPDYSQLLAALKWDQGRPAG